MSRPALASAIALAAAVVAFAACNDDKQKHPTAPESPAPVAAVAESPAGAAGAVSTVCLAYMNKASVAKSKLADAQEKHENALVRAALAKRIEKLDEMAKDACH